MRFVTYEPDEQNELIGDAMAVGGPAFVEEVHYVAIEAAEAVCPWDGNGIEPAEYRRARLGEPRRLVAQRRAELTAPTGTGLAAADEVSAAGRKPDASDVVSPRRGVLGALDSDGLS